MVGKNQTSLRAPFLDRWNQHFPPTVRSKYLEAYRLGCNMLLLLSLKGKM